MDNTCFGAICFVPLASEGPRIFGFAELISALALTVLAWTIANARYRFRVEVSPIPLRSITFYVVGILGLLTLVTDIWRAQEWLVPAGNLVTPAIWQGILGAVFLTVFLAWAWFAFICPPIFGKLNAKRYHDTLYRAIFKGSPTELAVIAEEFGSSAESLVRFAPTIGQIRDIDGGGEKSNGPSELPKELKYAHNTLLLIADRRFCRAIVESSPGTALILYQEVEKAGKYGIAMRTFSGNLLNESLKNRNSVFFHETEGYETGLIGYHKPLSQAMFSNYRMVEEIGTLLDADYEDTSEWDSTQWRVYCRLVLITWRAYVEDQAWNHSYVLYRAMNTIANSTDDLRKINGLVYGHYARDVFDQLRVVMNFIKRAVVILDENGVPEQVQLRVQELESYRDTIYDQLARMAVKVIRNASNVQSPGDLCWVVQHNIVWGGLFRHDNLKGDAGRVVQYKLRRLIYEEILNVRRFVDVGGAKILGYCLNVMGLTVSKESIDRESVALQKVVLNWTKQNFAWLHSYYPQVARACLVERMTYDENGNRLIKRFQATMARPDPPITYLQLDAREEKLDHS